MEAKYWTTVAGRVERMEIDAETAGDELILTLFIGGIAEGKMTVKVGDNELTWRGLPEKGE